MYTGHALGVGTKKPGLGTEGLHQSNEKDEQSSTVGKTDWIFKLSVRCLRFVFFLSKGGFVQEIWPLGPLT